MSRLLLTRHGHTNESVRGIVQGQRDTPLNDQGESAARCVGEYLEKHFRVKVIVTSDLRRAVDTAELIAACHTQVITVIKEPLLREISCGKFEGAPMRLLQELRSRDARGAEHAAPAGGESVAELRERVLRWLAAYVRRVDRETLVVTHRGPLMVMLQSFSRAPGSRALDNALEHCAVVTADISGLAMPRFIGVINPLRYVRGKNRTK